jgi:hypothetical protein
MLRPRPVTIHEFLRPPSLEEWNATLSLGWSGPDGSSSSLDDIEGIRIGITSTSYDHAHLPANWHDWLYMLGRTHRLPQNYRAAADALYCDRCLDQVAILIGWNGWKARTRCYIRYRALRLFGRHAWAHGWRLP